MTDGRDPWENTRKLLGEDFFEVRATEDEVRAAFERELEVSTAEDRPFSLIGFLARLRGSGMAELRPGVFFGGNPKGALALLAEHDALKARMADDGNGGWVSGAC